MKALSIFSALLLSFFMMSCSEDEDTATPAQIEANLKVGDWRVSSFTEDGDNHTDHFIGYKFNFNDLGAVTATKGSDFYIGTWIVNDSNSSDDSLDDLDFNLFFAALNDLQELNEDWEVTSQSGTKLELKHVSGGSGGTDFLTFVKN